VSWFNKSTGAARRWREILAELATIEGDVDIVFASGLIDPSASASDLMLANVDRPDWGDHRPEAVRYLTIGSVLETFPSLAASNRYLASKDPSGSYRSRARAFGLTV
jgi:hypothetical protein